MLPSERNEQSRAQLTEKMIHRRAEASQGGSPALYVKFYKALLAIWLICVIGSPGKAVSLFLPGAGLLLFPWVDLP